MLNRRKFLLQGGMTMAMGLGLSKFTQAQTSPNSSLRTSHLAVNGFVFDALAAGPKEGELVLCLHGFPEFKESWITILESLGALGYHAVAVDQRGYSSQARPTTEADYTEAALVSDVLGFAKYLGAETFRLVGHDRGGILGWVVGANYPDKLLSLTILSTPHKNAFVSAYANDPAQQAMSQYIPILAAPSPSGENFMLGNNAANFIGAFNGKVSPSTINLYQQRLEVPGAMTAVLNWYREGNDLTGSLGSVNVPTRYIWGAEDAYLGKTAAVSTGTYCNGLYDFVQLANRSHWLMDEDPLSIVALLHEQFTDKIN
jgi:pimeloyl-ACP methyl ester carboxylesterase